MTSAYPNENPDGTEYHGRLHEMDLGTHIHLLEEWNEVPFAWEGATVTACANEVIVTHPHFAGGSPGVAIAHYEYAGEGNLLELHCATEGGLHELVPRS